MKPDEPQDGVQTRTPEEPPPVLGSWRALYMLLVVELAVITLTSYALGWWAS